MTVAADHMQFIRECRALSVLLERALEDGQPVSLNSDLSPETLTLPDSLAQSLLMITRALGNGEKIVTGPQRVIDVELASRFLEESVDETIARIEAGELRTIPSADHRRIWFEDLAPLLQPDSQS